MDEKITIKEKRSRDVSNLDWKNTTNFDWKGAASAGAIGVGSAIAGDDPVFGGILSGTGMGALFGAFGALAGAGFGLLNGLKQKDAQELAERRQENLNQYGQDRAVTQALRADWVANSNPVMAALNGGNVEVQAMVAPGETIITEDGRVVRVKGKGNEDTVPWTDGPATVLGNLKMNGTGMKYKDFGKTYFKETKEGVKEAPGNFGARAAIGKILANMLEKDKALQGVKQKTAAVTGKTLKNLGKAKAPVVPAAFDGESFLGLVGQALPALYNLSIGSKPYDVEPLYLNPHSNEAPKYFRNNYDLIGNRRAAMRQLRSGIHDINSTGNTTGVGAMLRVALHTGALENLRNINRDWAVEQNKVNQAMGNYLHQMGAEDVQARIRQRESTAQNKAARDAMKASGYTQIGKLFGEGVKLFNQNKLNDLLAEVLQKLNKL